MIAICYYLIVRLIHRDTVREFIRIYPDSKSSLGAWAQNIECNQFRNPVELKQIFALADYVKPYWVFNIAGNKYRLIALVDFKLEIVFVECVLTHKEYDKGKWR